MTAGEDVQKLLMSLNRGQQQAAFGGAAATASMLRTLQETNAALHNEVRGLREDLRRSDQRFESVMPMMIKHALRGM